MNIVHFCVTLVIIKLFGGIIGFLLWFVMSCWSLALL